ncbi:restriction endonuclease subunit S [Loktanella sp. TSTF-M6]|uniref:Restriction endonuclease subunit S n=1 Tax=Loktanella gaetbuli TaxID=2881335 RepID=A0ABS8BST3_9RHOB|nr:restriction endonuclease subunit S [Loktanella gaetbuli]MCB5198776.1 restriction endonuclease subunit S [Loktanella gaetbuli]
MAALNWIQTTVGEAFKTVTGGTPPKSDETLYGATVPFIKPPELINGTINTASDGLSAKGAERAKIAPKGSVLVSCIGNLGKIGLATKDVAFNQQINAIFPHYVSALPEFVFYLTLSPSFQGQLSALSSGTTVSIVNKSRFNSISIALPPLGEQKRIIAVLDQAFAALDRARANAEANLSDASALFDSWLSTTFSSGLEHWPKKTLPEISENLDRLRVPITKGDRNAGNIPYYGASGVVDHVADHIFDEDLLLVSEDGANLLARTYPIAFSVSGKIWVNNHAHVLRFETIEAQEFVRLYLNSISLEPWTSGMAQPKLNQKALSKIPIPYPEEAERTRIVDEASEVWKASESAGKTYGAQIADLADLRQSLLQKAFSGELTA